MAGKKWLAGIAALIAAVLFAITTSRRERTPGKHALLWIWKPAGSSSRCGRSSRRTMSPASRNWRGRASTTAIVFHRVIDGFMAQTGDPTGTGSGGSGQKLKAEFSTEKHVRGVVSMARAQDPNSADSQFFIVFKASAFLNGKYTVWGRVVSGMEHVDAIKRGHPQSGKVDDPDKIISMKVAADVKE